MKNIEILEKVFNPYYDLDEPNLDYINKEEPIIYYDLEDEEDLDETFFKNAANKALHYIGHVNWMDGEEDDGIFGTMTIDEYNKAADKLSKEKVNTSDPNSEDDVVGFFSKDRRIIKYRKSTGEIVVYAANSWEDASTISYYKTRKNDSSSYIRKKKRDYKRELRPSDDYFNK